MAKKINAAEAHKKEFYALAREFNVKLMKLHLSKMAERKDPYVVAVALLAGCLDAVVAAFASASAALNEQVDFAKIERDVIDLAQAGVKDAVLYNKSVGIFDTKEEEKK